MARKKTNFFKKKISGLMQKKLVMLFGAIILAFVFLIGWITYINASKGEKYTKVVLDQQQYNNRTIPFKRGDIVDRNGTKLATSERVYNVVVDAKTITSNKKYINPTIKALSKCFDLKKKDVRKQIKKNPFVAICAVIGGDWLRISCELVEDDDREARASMLSANPELMPLYDPDDGNMQVFYMKNATAVFSSLTKPREIVTF